MKSRFIAACALFPFISSGPWAATYTYTGQAYSESGYYSGVPDGVEYDGDGVYSRIGGHGPESRMSISFEVDGTLAADTTYVADPLRRLDPGMRTLGHLAFAVSDGLGTTDFGSDNAGAMTVGYRLGAYFEAEFRTDAFGNIAEWFFDMFAGGAPDGYKIRSSSSAGDVTEYSSEYGYHCQIGPDCPQGGYETSEHAWARTTQRGTWAMADLAQVPLPAGAPLTVAGLGLLGLLRRRKGRSGSRPSA